MAENKYKHLKKFFYFDIQGTTYVIFECSLCYVILRCRCRYNGNSQYFQIYT